MKLICEAITLWILTYSIWINRCFYLPIIIMSSLALWSLKHLSSQYNQLILLFCQAPSVRCDWCPGSRLYMKRRWLAAWQMKWEKQEVLLTHFSCYNELQHQGGNTLSFSRNNNTSCSGHDIRRSLDHYGVSEQLSDVVYVGRWALARFSETPPASFPLNNSCFINWKVNEFQCFHTWIMWTISLSKSFSGIP